MATKKCPTCGLVNPGPEHRAYEPLLCAEKKSPNATAPHPKGGDALA